MVFNLKNDNTMQEVNIFNLKKGNTIQEVDVFNIKCTYQKEQIINFQSNTIYTYVYVIVI
jgi:hypothetical protein